ncbi:MAG: hypothetical protein D6730_17255 [Bacteroidetes bacterium]|nr:MAG: hypothetical protein D6730_17255 [Bacteroidota bacterium]
MYDTETEVGKVERNGGVIKAIFLDLPSGLNSLSLYCNRTVILELQEQGLGLILPGGIESPSFF